jgi:hypothetical protein
MHDVMLHMMPVVHPLALHARGMPRAAACVPRAAAYVPRITSRNAARSWGLSVGRTPHSTMMQNHDVLELLLPALHAL